MRSHFLFSNKERRGIFTLLLLIGIGQSLYWFVEVSDQEALDNDTQLNVLRQEIDSLRGIQLEHQKPKLFPFNPNFITDYKGYTLGMSTEEIDRLLQYRAKDKWINSKQEFQAVTKVSDSLLAIIAPFFKFPDWVSNPRPEKPRFQQSNYMTPKPKSVEEKIDLNLATASQLQKIYGVGEKLSGRIIAYRNKYPGGFHHDIELSEIYGLSEEVINRITQEFTVKTPRVVTKLDLNLATRDELVKIQYIDYDIAHAIIEERTLRDGFKSIEELTKIEDFPVKKLEIIKLYLHL